MEPTEQKLDAFECVVVAIAFLVLAGLAISLMGCVTKKRCFKSMDELNNTWADICAKRIIGEREKCDDLSLQNRVQYLFILDLQHRLRELNQLDKKGNLLPYKKK